MTDSGRIQKAISAYNNRVKFNGQMALINETGETQLNRDMFLQGMEVMANILKEK